MQAARKGTVGLRYLKFKVFAVDKLFKQCFKLTIGRDYIVVFINDKVCH
jgi:hypothetical protein